ncbi:acyltransferase family protein [Falsirhodobacter sp. 20TX0035]|uniref:acyltransferase family protein n=1 Tax=Falsirhodobacter sp. 20TX0035 TaxID=3022019 RepID=UPI0023301B2B|nr:acyltransferase [Falsirhodobacter sp. 20TX0035]MDB6453503.1 acyltransferase [Falsirhodobacter sp. 20TX0035]
MSEKRAHYLLLDGARGIAAICILLYHLGDYFGGLRFLQGSFLAVDMFFLMSGFVIALTYERSLTNGSRPFLSFVWTRVLRLYPLYLMACCLGAFYFITKYLMNMEGAPTASELLRVLPATVFLAPWPEAVEWGFTPYPFASSAWSLSLELWYNILYAILAIHLGTRMLLVVIAVSLAILLQQGLHFDTLDMGWSMATALGGSARFWLSFGVGILIYRHQLHRLATPKLPIYVYMLCFAFVFIPRDAIALSMFWIAVVFPVTVIAGGARQVNGLAAFLCNHLGRMSYGIYILHAPVILLQTGVLKILLGNSWEDYKAQIGISIILSVLIIAWIGTYLFDEPVRRRLKAWSGKRSGTTLPPTLSA